VQVVHLAATNAGVDQRYRQSRDDFLAFVVIKLAV